MTDALRQQPTVELAVAWLLMNPGGGPALFYRRLCVKFWREAYGEEFASRIEQQFEKQYSDRRGRT